MTYSKLISLVSKPGKIPLVSVDGLLSKRPSDSELKKLIPDEVQRNIYIKVFDNLVARNLNFTDTVDLVLAYSYELSQYFILTKEAGDEVVSERRDDNVINPKLVQANRCLRNSLDLSKMLGIDPKSRQSIAQGAIPVDSSKKKSKFDI